MNQIEDKVLDVFENSPEVDLVETALNLFTPLYKERYKQIAEKYKDVPDEELEKLVQLSVADRQLRISFWGEVRAAIREGRQGNPANIYAGICTRQNFYTRITKCPERLAWLMRPQKDYVKQAEEIIDYGLSKLRDALNCKVQFNNGHMDTKAVKTMLDILSYFENRTKGPVKQKIQIDSTSMNANVTIDVSNSMDDIERRIEEARKRVAEYEGKALIQGVPEIVNVQKSE